MDTPDDAGRKPRRRPRIPAYGIVGASIIACAELLLVVRFVPVGIYCTPIVWIGYILFMDALNWALYGRSYIRSRPREFAAMLPWSVVCWLLFEPATCGFKTGRMPGFRTVSFFR